MDNITVLSLCDGMSCGQIALNRLGIKIKQYYAVEIKPSAIQVTQHNYPNTIQLGDVNKISYQNGILSTEKGNFEVPQIDLIMFGSPCQSFSIACKAEQRIGLANKEKSGLFLECHRILKEINPKYFLIENVASMKKEDRQTLTDFIGIEPVRINSKVISPALRDRLYWTNIPIVKELKEKNIILQDILENGYTDRVKARALMEGYSRPSTTPIKMFHRYYKSGFTTLIFKDRQHYEDCVKYYNTYCNGLAAKDLIGNETDVFNGVRYLTPHESEQCQTVPIGYTDCLTPNEAIGVLGDGWTIDVICYLLEGIKE